MVEPSEPRFSLVRGRRCSPDSDYDGDPIDRADARLLDSVIPVK